MIHVTDGVSWYRRGTALLLVSGMVLAMAGSAWAEDLEDQIRDNEEQLQDTERELGDAKEELAHSTKELDQATKAYEQAAAQLPAAEDSLASAEAALADANERLEQARAEVAAARAADAKAADKLAKAEQRVEDQKARIAEVNERIEGKRASISRVASQAYQRGTGGELATLAAALNATDPHELLASMEATKAVVGAETSVLTELRDDRVELANQRVLLEDLQAEAEELRRQATERLKETEQKEAQARAAKEEAAQAAAAAADAKAEVESLIDTREEAKAAADGAREENERQHQRLKAERNSIQDDINRLEREHAERERERQRERERERERDQDRNDEQPPDDDNDDDDNDTSSGLRYPVANPHVTSPFGMRTHPITGVRKLHDGTDFRAYCGTPIRAAASGTVEWSTYRGGYGNQIAVDHGGKVTTYSHLSRFAVGAGTHVSQGQVVGYSGTTGLSTACHLHFMLYVGGALQNPMAYLG